VLILLILLSVDVENVEGPGFRDVQGIAGVLFGIMLYRTSALNGPICFPENYY